MKTVLLASGSGTLLQAIIDNVDRNHVEITAVGADRPCEALRRAERANIPTFLVEYTPRVTDRETWNRDLVKAIQAHQPDLIVSAGFMRILGAEVINAFPNSIINTHPALLPAFPGAHAVEDALAYGAKVTGSTVHVVDTGVDTGPIIAQQAVPIHPNDTVDELHEAIKTVERKLIVDVIHNIATNGLTIEGRKVRTTANDN